MLKAFNRSAATKVPWEQNDFVNFMVKLGINSGKYKGVHESTVGTYSKQINKDESVFASTLGTSELQREQKSSSRKKNI